LIWLACASLPEQLVVEVAQFADQWIWSSLKTTKLSACEPFCRDLAFGMIVVPVSSVLAVGVAFRLYAYGAPLAMYYEDLKRRRALSTSIGLAPTSIANFFRRAPGNLIFVVIVFGWLFYVAFLPIGELSHGPAVKPYTSLGYAAIVAFLSDCVAVIGFYTYLFWHADTYNP
jgi:hypothetical protein